jgi:pimeloyl-ACP methyl ester carboxylesterase
MQMFSRNRRNILPLIPANGINLYYEERGNPVGIPILLIMGLGRQMIAWPEDFMTELAKDGHRIILFDNRDAGLSTHFHDALKPNLPRAILATLLGFDIKRPYSLDDLAQDAFALLDHLSIPAAHIVGVSMGGMIAQIMAATIPNRVLSLTSVMSSSGAAGLPGASATLRKQLLQGQPKQPSRSASIEFAAKTMQLMSYPDPARAPDAFLRAASLAYDRSYDPLGTARQLTAIIANGSRVKRLKAITAPTLVIHGANDELVPLACGRNTARHIAGARLEVVEKMAHDLPPSQTNYVAELIRKHIG